MFCQSPKTLSKCSRSQNDSSEITAQLCSVCGVHVEQSSGHRAQATHRWRMPSSNPIPDTAQTLVLRTHRLPQRCEHDNRSAKSVTWTPAPAQGTKSASHSSSEPRPTRECYADRKRWLAPPTPLHILRVSQPLSLDTTRAVADDHASVSGAIFVAECKPNSMRHSRRPKFTCLEST